MYRAVRAPVRVRTLGLQPHGSSGPEVNKAGCLAVTWATTLYIHFGVILLPNQILPLQNSLCVQVLCSPILPALLQGTLAAAVSQTLWRGTWTGITELSQKAPPIFGWVAITSFLWSPMEYGRPSYFHAVIMVALCHRADHYIFILFLSSSFFSSPNLSGRILDVYHTLAHGVALVGI